MPRPPAIYRPMTPGERATVCALARCTFPTGSFSKRFARDLRGQAGGESDPGTITDKQAERLAVQAYIYRRQMPPHLVPSSPPPGYQTPRQRALSVTPSPCHPVTPSSPPKPQTSKHTMQLTEEIPLTLCDDRELALLAEHRDYEIAAAAEHEQRRRRQAAQTGASVTPSLFGE